MREIARTRPRWGTGFVVATLLAVALAIRPGWASPVDEGRPILRTFTPHDYQGAARIAELVIAPDGTLLAAAAGDVVTYDGARFDRVETTIPRIHALAVAPDGARAYVGGDDQIGVVERGPAGSWTYRSLVEALPASARPLGRIGAIAVAGSDAWFAADTKLLRLRGRTLSVIALDGPAPTTIVPSGDVVYVHRTGEGLFRIDGDRVAAVTNDPLVVDAPVVAAFPVSGGVIVAQHRHGLVRIEAGRARVANGELAAIAASRGLTAAARTTSGGFVLATEGGGLVLTDAEGAIEGEVAREHVGTASSLTCDRDGSVWAATPEGIVQISLLGAVTRFDARDGLPRSPFAAVLRHRGSLLLAAEGGVYALRPGAPESQARATFVLLTDRVPRPNDLVESGGLLYASGTGGIWRLDGAEARHVFSAPGVFTDLAVWSIDPDVVLAAGPTGLLVLRRDGDRLVELKAFTDLGEVRTIADDPETGVWLGTSSHGIHRVTLGPGAGVSAWDEAQVRTYDARNGKLGDGPGAVAVGIAPGGIFAAGPTRVLRYETTADAFRPDDRFTLDGTPLSRLWPVAVVGPQRFWASASMGARRSDFPLARVDRVAGGLWKLHAAPAPVLDGLGFGGESSIVVDATSEDEIVWAAGFGELYRIRASALGTPPARPALAISSVSGGGRVQAVEGAKREGKLASRIPHSREPLRIGFGAPSLLPGSDVEYRWRLEGWDDAWSAWSPSREASFSSLPAGSYRFVVEARDRSGVSAPAASVRFRMSPPPWLSWWAWSGYGLLSAFGLWGVLRIRGARAESELQRLEQLVAERTTEAAQSREVAAEAERAKSRFLARVGEELKPQLDGILGFARAIEHDPEIAVRHRERLGAVQESGDHLRSLMGEIEELIQVEAGHVELREDAFSVSALIRDVETAFVSQARERGLGFYVATRDLPRGPVTGDVRRLRQVLEHLIGGAMRITERGELRLTVIGEPRSGTVHFAVSDTGPGVLPEEPEAELGLAMSRQFVELMGSRLEVAAQPGEGSTSHFAVVLPEVSDEPAPPVAVRGWLDARRPGA